MNNNSVINFQTPFLSFLLFFIVYSSQLYLLFDLVFFYPYLRILLHLSSVGLFLFRLRVFRFVSMSSFFPFLHLLFLLPSSFSTSFHFLHPHTDIYFLNVNKRILNGFFLFLYQGQYIRGACTVKEKIRKSSVCECVCVCVRVLTFSWRKWQSMRSSR